MHLGKSYATIFMLWDARLLFLYGFPIPLYSYIGVKVEILGWNSLPECIFKVL